MTERISVLSRKGGVGKTVSAIYTAALLAEQGKDVAILDKDPEGSAGAWARAAGDLPFPVYPEGKQAQALKHTWVVIDALLASGFSGPWGILLTQARGGLGREMKVALEEEDLPVYGVIPHLIKYERAFGTLPDDLSEYREALAEALA